MTTELKLNTEALNRVCERQLALENRMVRLEDKIDRILVALGPFASCLPLGKLIKEKRGELW
jgi:hypothetical protein